MWLRNNSIFKELKYLKISIRLTLTYSVMIAVILLIINLLTLSGLYFVLYHQAEVEIDISTKKTMRQLELGAIMDPSFRKSESLVLMPGVVLRIFDSEGKQVYDSEPNYFKMEWLEEHKVENPPIWANTDVFSVIQSKNMTIYRRDVPMTFNGNSYDMVFFKVVTAENSTLESIKQILLGADLVGIIIALLVGHFVIKGSLKPVRALNDTAKSIQVDDLSRRIEVSPANDELTELANTFNTMLDRLEAGFKAQQKFVSDASHELRTPLTVISGYADMLERWGGKDPEVLSEAISAIKSEAGDMQALIEKLLFLARADQKRQILKKEPADMGEIIEDGFKKISIAASQHEIKLLASEGGIVFADIVTMRQLLRIFLENSMKYTPSGGHIAIAGYIDKEYNNYIVEISDDGVGIAKEDQEKIFQRFYRVDSSRTRAAGTPGGTGLGLSIAKWIADRHDIKISLESELGKGTKFILTMPLYVEENS